MCFAQEHDQRAGRKESDGIVLELGSRERKLIYIGRPDFLFLYKCAILEANTHSKQFVDIDVSV